MKLIKRFRKSQIGATLVEYSIIIAMIGAAVAATVYLIGEKVDADFNQVYQWININKK